MKKSLGLISIICLLCGLGAGGLGGWLYYHARGQARLSKTLQERSVNLEDQSYGVRGTAEEKSLLEESAKADRDAEAALSFAKSNQRLALISGISSIVLILSSVAMIVLNLRNRDADAS